MTTQVIDAENNVNDLSTAPDKLRAEIGEYYGQITNLMTGEVNSLFTKNFASGRIRSAQIEPVSTNNQVLIPIKRSTITIEGEENVFRDHIQWNDYISETILENRQFLDHTFTLTPPTVSSEFVKNFHHPDYEDNTKAFASNQLLNYNLLSYPHDSETIQNIGYIRTKFDLLPVGDMSPSQVMEEFGSRMANYTGSISEIDTKQRNIFDLDSSPINVSDIQKEYPYYYRKRISAPELSRGFSATLDERKKLKNLFSSIKKDLSFDLRSFTIGNYTVQGKIFNATNLLTSTRLIRFTEASDELFLLPEDEVNHSNPSERFIDQIDAVKFLSAMRKEIELKSRTLEQIFNCENSDNFFLGFKIEKYLDNDATRPIQTYYTTSNNLIDTQLKYGRRYIYKTKLLLGIFGSSYSYSNLIVAQSEADEGAPTSEKYWATVDVEIQPSFRILEYEIDVDEIAFIDTPMLTPHVTAYGTRNKPLVNFLLQPRFFTLSDVGEEDIPPVGILRPSDKQISDLYSLSGDLRSAPDYFNGVYEVYRLSDPPVNKESFKDGFIRVVDESIRAGNLDFTRLPIENIDIDYARFVDIIIPNKKYYYAFRSLTYHETPSQLTEPLEIELQRDSDEYKIVVKQYRYPQENNYVFKKRAKRLIKLVPNIQRLLFSTEVDQNTWELGDVNEEQLVSRSTGANKTFKIRITSKHTGKKIDLNVTFKLNSDDTFH
tara:strand:+ start:5558 stop:7702 length:2145 start_codon:yes stop_codon:yes gene_type:complete